MRKLSGDPFGRETERMRVAGRISTRAAAHSRSSMVTICLGGAVAERVGRGFFHVPGDAVLFDEGDDVGGGVAGERGFGEVRVGGEKVFGAGVDVGEVAAASAGDEDLLADALGVVEDEDAAVAASGLNRWPTEPSGARLRGRLRRLIALRLHLLLYASARTQPKGQSELGSSHSNRSAHLLKFMELVLLWVVARRLPSCSYSMQLVGHWSRVSGVFSFRLELI